MIGTQNALRHDVGGLSHLVEAATALTRLVEMNTTPPLSSSDDTQQPDSQRSVVSDADEDEDRRRKLRAVKQNKREIFPQRLMAILSDTSLSEVISWLPHGRSFVIIRPDIFTEEVLPKYLPPVDARASTKYPSFTRKLNRWGFRQATRGPDTGAFHHPLFRRDQPDLCLQMDCQKSREQKTQQKRSLPPKKRVVAENKSKSVGNQVRKIPASRTLSVDGTNNPTVNTVSGDERSVASNANYSAASIPRVEPGTGNRAPVIVTAETQDRHPQLMPFISNDATFVQDVLRQRDAAESIRAAKSMLYESYLRALRG